MLGSKYKIVLGSQTRLVDYTKSGQAKFDATIPAGEHIAIQTDNPSDPKGGENWLIFEGTTIGATISYIRNCTDATIEALS